MLYFAYGSNMNWDQMRRRCPSARFVAVAALEGYRLDFTHKSTRLGCGVADIVREESETVWGVVYQLDELDVGRLDRCEGYCPQSDASAYRRKEARVLQDDEEDKPLTVWTYEVCSKSCRRIPPNKDYKDLLVSGARHWRLPDCYICKLEAIRVAP